MTHRIHPFLCSAALTLLASGGEVYGQQPPAYGQPPQAGGASAAPVGVAPIGVAPGVPAGQPAVAPPSPPFVLDRIDEQFVFQTLQMWETESAEIERFNAKFMRLEYDKVWGPGSDKEHIRCAGTLSYAKPDKGSFKIDEIYRWTKADPQNPLPDAPGEYVLQKDEVGEHWVCDGKSVYEYDHRNKQLVVTPIPPEMQGKSIVDGPLPFLFGAEAQKLVDRYWIRAKPSTPEQIWLEAFPKRQIDAANYDSVEVMLNRKTMQPSAIKVFLPGGQQQHVYVFSDAKINDKLGAWFDRLFGAPNKPIGWKRVVQQDRSAAPGPQAANPAAEVRR
jgi:TIGR03009 family protein